MYKTDAERMSERDITTVQVVNIHADTQRFRLAHALFNEEFEEASLAVYDERTNHGIVLNLYPMEGGPSLEDKNGLPVRFQIDVVLVNPKGEKFTIFEDVVYPEMTHSEDTYER